MFPQINFLIGRVKRHRCYFIISFSGQIGKAVAGWAVPGKLGSIANTTSNINHIINRIKRQFIHSIRTPTRRRVERRSFVRKSVVIPRRAGRQLFPRRRIEIPNVETDSIVGRRRFAVAFPVDGNRHCRRGRRHLHFEHLRVIAVVCRGQRGRPKTRVLRLGGIFHFLESRDCSWTGRTDGGVIAFVSIDQT